MRTVTYVLGHYAAPKKQGTLREFLIDMDWPLRHRMIPPFEILNLMLEEGESPRTGEWEPFSISQDEYDELVADLLSNEMDRFRLIEADPIVKTPKDWWAFITTMGY